MAGVVGPQIHNVPTEWQPDTAPQIHYLEPTEGNNGGVQYVAHGEPVQRLLNSGMNLDVMRPYLAFSRKRRGLVPVVNNGHYVNNEGKKIPKVALTTNAVLREDEWKTIDATVMEVARAQLRFYSDLVAAGLTYPLDPFATSILGWDKMTDDDGDARFAMAPDIPPEEGRVTFEREYIPIPFVTKGFTLDARELGISRNAGTSFDVEYVRQATMKVTEALEKLTLLGTAGITYGGGSIYGALNYPHRGTGSLTANWTATARDPVEDLMNMIQDSVNIYHNGPWNLYVPTAYRKPLDDDYVSGYPKTVRSRLMELEGLSSIRVSDYMTANNILLMEFSPLTVRMIVGFEPRTIEWSNMAGMKLQYMVMACLVPNFRADANNRCGIIHYS